MEKIRKSVNLSQFSNYKIGGPARFFLEAKNEDEVNRAITFGREKGLDVFVLGGGTNLLIADEGWNGLVVKPAINVLEVRGEKIAAGSGVLMRDLLEFAAEHFLSGLEWAGGLPGTLGGAIRGNAGCFGGEIKDVIESVRSFDMKTTKVIERTTAECAFGYRDSIFKRNGIEIILSAVLRLKKGDREEIMKAAEEKIAHRNKNHPLEYPNIGSIFKNVPLSKILENNGIEYNDALAKRRVVYKGSEFSVKNDPFPVISAAKLISESGLRGRTSGGATISEKHPNFIVNVANAKASNVKDLMRTAKQHVREKFGIELEEEVQIL